MVFFCLVHRATTHIGFTADPPIELSSFTPARTTARKPDWVDHRDTIAGHAAEGCQGREGAEKAVCPHTHRARWGI